MLKSHQVTAPAIPKMCLPCLPSGYKDEPIFLHTLLITVCYFLLSGHLTSEPSPLLLLQTRCALGK